MIDPQEIQHTVLSRRQLRDMLAEILHGDVAAHTRNRDEPTDHALRNRIDFVSNCSGPTQVRYRYEGADWIDTIMPIDASTVHLIRAPQGCCEHNRA